MISLLNEYRYQKSAKQNIAIGVSRTSVVSEMGLFAIIVYSLKPLTIFMEKSVLDVVGILDPSLIKSALLMMSNMLIFCRLLKYKIISLENGCRIETSRESLSLY